MTYNFDNIAISCDTWQQMERLAEIAEKQGAKTQEWAYSKTRFNNGHCIFVNRGYLYFSTDFKMPSETGYTFTTFITSHPDYSVEGC